MRAEHEISHHNSIGCTIRDCIIRYSADYAQKMRIHRLVHIISRKHGAAEPVRWTADPEAGETQGGDGDQAIISPL